MVNVVEREPQAVGDEHEHDRTGIVPPCRALLHGAEALYNIHKHRWLPPSHDCTGRVPCRTTRRERLGCAPSPDSALLTLAAAYTANGTSEHGTSSSCVLRQS